MDHSVKDHVITDISFSYDRQGLPASPFLHLNPLNLFDFFLRSGRGALAHSGIATVGFVHSPLSPEGASRPDLELHVCPFDYGLDYGVSLRDKLVNCIVALRECRFLVISSKVLLG